MKRLLCTLTVLLALTSAGLAAAQSNYSTPSDKQTTTDMNTTSNTTGNTADNTTPSNTTTSNTTPSNTSTSTTSSTTTTDQYGNTTDNSANMPKTASPLPLIAALSLITLAAGYGLMNRRRRA